MPKHLTGVIHPANVLYMNTNTTTTVPAEIVLTSIEGATWIFVNGEHVGTEAAGVTMVKRIDQALKANRVFRQTEYVAEAGALIAEGQMVVAA